MSFTAVAMNRPSDLQPGAPVNLQEIFLTQLRRERRPVTMFLMNGFQMRGYVTGFDAFSVVLTSDGKQMFVYKHAISTITPERPVPLTEQNSGE